MRVRLHCWWFSLSCLLLQELHAAEVRRNKELQARLSGWRPFLWIYQETQCFRSFWQGNATFLISLYRKSSIVVHQPSYWTHSSHAIGNQFTNSVITIIRLSILIDSIPVTSHSTLRYSVGVCNSISQVFYRIGRFWKALYILLWILVWEFTPQTVLKSAFSFIVQITIVQ